MKSQTKKILLAIIVLALAGAACTLPDFGQYLVEPQEIVKTAPPQEVAPPDPYKPPNTWVVPDLVLLQDELVGLYSAISPGVVFIQVYSPIGSGLGSGFVINKQGFIVTNYHVVENAESVEVHFQNGIKVFGEVVGVDLDSDIAVIKVDVDPEYLVPLTLGDSQQVRVGQTVVAIGNPYGLSGTMTVGIVSARGRTLDSVRQTAGGSFFSAGDLIQTDATINPGNSGGPLLNLNGEVIGINRAIQTSGMTGSSGVANTGIGFAVSSNILKLVIPALMRGETYAYPYLGLSALPSLSLTEAEYLNLPQATGAYVVEIVSGGPSDEAGLQSGQRTTEIQGLYAGGDLIIAVDDQPVLQFSDLLSYIMLNKEPGDQMGITVLRDGKEMTFTVDLGSRSASGL